MHPILIYFSIAAVFFLILQFFKDAILNSIKDEIVPSSDSIVNLAFALLAIIWPIVVISIIVDLFTGKWMKK